MSKYVNVSTANIYHKSSFNSCIDSQAVLWENVKVIEEKGRFSRIICEDGYKGWIDSKQLADGQSLDKGERKLITGNSMIVWQDSNENSLPIRDGAAGGYIVVINEKNGLLQVVLPDGQTGWTSRECIEPLPNLTRNNMVAFAHSYLGVSYFWGGKNPRGMDCSGYVQLVHKLFGMSIRRESAMQFEDSHPVSDDPLEGQPGDLLFFAESGTQITHVGFCLGDGKILHARAMIRINSLHRQDEDFDRQLLDSFVGVRTFFK